MKVKYLGTAAAERIPAMFCNCDVCRRAIELGGKDLKSQAQVLIDEHLLIDFSGDTYSHFLRMNRTLWDIENVLITHSHIDHFTFEAFALRAVGNAYNVSAPKLRIYTSQGVIDKLWECLKVRGNKKLDKIPERIEFIPLTYYQTVQIGEHKVTPLPAQHAGDEQAFLYLIERDGKAMFYGNDTGFFDDDIDQWLIANNKHVDLLSLDCTKGDKPFTYITHMGMQEGRVIADRFLQQGIIDGNTKLYYTHFSHNCGMIHDELENAARKYGFSVSYDGLSVII